MSSIESADLQDDPIGPLSHTLVKDTIENNSFTDECEESKNIIPVNQGNDDKVEEDSVGAKLEVMSNSTDNSHLSIGHPDLRFSSGISGFSSDSLDIYVGESVIEGTPDPLQILQAAKNKDIEGLTKLVIKGSDINVQNSEGQTALHFSVINGSIDCVAAILAFDDTNPNLEDIVGNCPLHIACKNAIPELECQKNSNDGIEKEESTMEAIASLLIKDTRTNLNVLDGGRLTPVIISTILGSTNIVRRLAENGADLNLKAARVPALCVACEHGLVDIVHILLQNNAKPNCRDSRGYTPLHIACEKGHLDIVKLLIEYNANASLELQDSRLKPYQMTTNQEIIDLILGKQTSITHPLRIDFIRCDEIGQGRLGISMCPGRNKNIHRRDADMDIDELIRSGTQVLISLIRNSELRSMGIPDLLEKVSKAGIQVIHGPIRDKWIPSSMDFLIKLVNRIVDLMQQGRSVVIHCNGGKGRSGLVAVSTLVAMGIDTGKATNLVRATKNGMLYNPAQILYIKAFKIAIRAKRRKSSKVVNEMKEMVHHANQVDEDSTTVEEDSENELEENNHATSEEEMCDVIIENGVLNNSVDSQEEKGENNDTNNEQPNDNNNDEEEDHNETKKDSNEEQDDSNGTILLDDKVKVQNKDGNIPNGVVLEEVPSDPQVDNN